MALESNVSSNDQVKKLTGDLAALHTNVDDWKTRCSDLEKRDEV